MITLKPKLQRSSDLPLLSQTPDAWASFVLQHTNELLSDHVYLEKKAAVNALELLNRWPPGFYNEQWILFLSGVAKDETLHLDRVMRLLSKRGGQLQRKHRINYANDLRNLVRKGWGKEELIDRLLISSLIEARSCERFSVLARNAKDKELADFYQSLWSSEFGHYQVFHKCAEMIFPKDAVHTRWQELLKEEARIIASQPAVPSILGGVGMYADGTGSQGDTLCNKL